MQSEFVQRSFQQELVFSIKKRLKMNFGQKDIATSDSRRFGEDFADVKQTKDSNDMSFSQKELNGVTASTPNGNWWPVASSLLIIIFTLLLPPLSNAELVFKIGEFGLLLKCESIQSKPPTPLSEESEKLSKFCFSLLHLVGEFKAAEEGKLRVDDVVLLRRLRNQFLGVVGKELGPTAS
uniref:Uncharacterized protein n=1 Tax=Glossina brevipalpis TaxID=37001 RepID=A0A1A9WMW0_9MUSC